MSNSTRVGFGTLFLVMLLVAGTCGNLHAQATASGTLQGTVTDKSGAVIPNAEVTVSRKDIALSRTTTTNDSGLYRFELLPAGTYSVSVVVKGFATANFQNVELIVGRTTNVDANLAPSSVAEVVTVEAAGAALVDTTRADISRPVNPQEVVELPNNSRDFAAMAVLAPGARPVNSYDPTKNRIGVFAVNGSNGRNVNVTVNGIDNKDNTVGGPNMQLPMEAIQEFNISTQRFSAANGRSEGAAINVITKTGTNDLHGSLYYMDRRDTFQAVDYFSAQGGQPKPPFLRQQFGGSAGAPIKKDKAFIFFAIEREREQTAFPVTPTAYKELTLVRNLGAQPSTTIPTPFYEWRYNGRLDYRFNERHSLALSYSNQQNNGLNDQSGNTNDLSAGNFTTNQYIIANATLTSVVSPTKVNVATIGYQYWNNLIDSSTRVPELLFPDAQFGTNTNVPQQSFQKKYQFKDDFSWNHGKHSLQIGADFLHEPVLGGFFIFNATPNITFFDDPSVILGNAKLYPQGFATPGAVQSISVTSGNPYFIESAKMFGTYVQDTWRASKRLTVSLGLRWDRDFNLNAGSIQAKARPYQELKTIGSPYAGGLPHDENYDFSPRIGIAYDLTGTGKHVFRAGYGMYFGQTFINTPLFMMQQANQFLFTQVAYNSAGPGDATADIVPTTGKPLSQFRYGVDPPPEAAPLSSQLAPGSIGRMLDPNFRNPYTEQINGGYSWAVTPSSVIEVEYVHVLSLHEAKAIIINPKIGGVRNTDAAFKAAGVPVIGRIQDYQSIGRSRYDGLNVSYRKRMTNHFTVNTSYVLSKALSYNGAGGSFGNAPTNLLNIFSPVDFGPSPTDERHRWVLSGIVELPFGVKFAPVMQLASARPYQATEGISDVYAFGGGAGATHAITLDTDPFNLLSTKSYSTAQLQGCLNAGTCHQVQAYALRGQAFFELDTKFAKDFKIKERGRLECFFQAFDLTNRANFSNSFQGNIRSGIFQQPTGFLNASGIIVPHSFTGEFGARFSF